MTEWERQREKDEFSRASVLYRPLNSLFADRFTPATNTNDPQNISSGLKKSAPRETTIDLKSNSAEGASQEKQFDDNDEMSSEMKAAKMGMYGKLTRAIHEWHPDKLLCKRFNIPDPYPGSRERGVPGRGRKSKASSFFERDFLSITSSSQHNEQMETNEDKETQEDDEDEFSSRLKKKNYTNTELDSNNKKKSMKIGPLSHLNRNFGAIDKESSGAEQVVAPSLASTQLISATSKTNGSTINSTGDKPPIDIFKAIFDDSDTSDSSSSDSEDKVKNIDFERKKDNISDDHDSIDVSGGHSARLNMPTSKGNKDNATTDNIIANNALGDSEDNSKDNDNENIQLFGKNETNSSIAMSSSSATSVYRPKQVGPLAFLHNDKEVEGDNNDDINEYRERGLRENMLRRASNRESIKKREIEIENRTTFRTSLNDDKSSTRRDDVKDRLHRRDGNRESFPDGVDEWTEKSISERDTSRKRRNKLRGDKDDKRHRRKSPISSDSDNDDDDEQNRSLKRNKTKKSKHKKSSGDKKTKKSKKAKKQHKKHRSKKKKSDRDDSDTDSDEETGQTDPVVPSNSVLLEKLQQYRAVTGKRPSAADFM